MFTRDPDFVTEVKVRNYLNPKPSTLNPKNPM